MSPHVDSVLRRASTRGALTSPSVAAQHPRRCALASTDPPTRWLSAPRSGRPRRQPPPGPSLASSRSSNSREPAGANRRGASEGDAAHRCGGGVRRFLDSAPRMGDVCVRWLSFRTRQHQLDGQCVEAFWRQAKHQWLFLNTLDSETALRRHMSAYVAAHNGQIPHWEFRGQTPDEMCFGTGEAVPGEARGCQRASAGGAPPCQPCGEL